MLKGYHNSSNTFASNCTLVREKKEERENATPEDWLTLTQH